MRSNVLITAHYTVCTTIRHRDGMETAPQQSCTSTPQYKSRLDPDNTADAEKEISDYNLILNVWPGPESAIQMTGVL